MRRLMARARFASALVLLAALLAPGFAGCLDVGDQICTESDVATDKDDRCPYGPPGGPKVPGGDCPIVVQESDPTQCDGITWADSVYPILVDPLLGNCSSTGCHGEEPGARGVYVPEGDPQKGFDELSAYTNAQQLPYINIADPARSWLVCNIEGSPGGGSPMPKPSGLTDAAAIATIRQWVACGAKP